MSTTQLGRCITNQHINATIASRNMSALFEKWGERGQYLPFLLSRLLVQLFSFAGPFSLVGMSSIGGIMTVGLHSMCVIF